MKTVLYFLFAFCLLGCDELIHKEMGIPMKAISIPL